jgi:hypothetical protein
MNHQKAAYQICAAQRDALLSELEKVGRLPECSETVWKAILAAQSAAREVARKKEQELRATDRNEPERIDLARLSEIVDYYMSWAQTWHKQAGGYMASDTLLGVMAMERFARQLQELTGKPERPLRRVE